MLLLTAVVLLVWCVLLWLFCVFSCSDVMCYDIVYYDRVVTRRGTRCCFQSCCSPLSGRAEGMCLHSHAFYKVSIHLICTSHLPSLYTVIQSGVVSSHSIHTLPPSTHKGSHQVVSWQTLQDTWTQYILDCAVSDRHAFSL